MKKRIKLTESQFTNMIRLDEEFKNDPITKKYSLINKRLAAIWVNLSSLSISDIFNMGNELNSLKDELDAMIDKINVISSEGERMLGKIESEFGKEEMYMYDTHYDKLNSSIAIQVYSMFDFIESLINVSKHEKLEKVFPSINI
jgi:hypothetical protein